MLKLRRDSSSTPSLRKVWLLQGKTGSCKEAERKEAEEKGIGFY